MSGRTLVNYVIAEDVDDFEHPNVFAVHKNIEKLCISDIIDAFPLPGDYHFRFKVDFKKTFVWEDAVHMDVPVPTYKGGVSLKISRLRPSEPSRNKSVSPASLPAASTQGIAPSKRVSPVRNRRPSSEDLLNMLGSDNTFIDSVADFSGRTSGSSPNAFGNDDLMGVDFGTSPVNTPPMMNTALGGMGNGLGRPAATSRRESAPATTNTANLMGQRASSISSTNSSSSPRSSAIESLMGGSGFDFNLKS